MPDLARAYFAEGEVRGKPGGGVAAGIVPLVAVFAGGPLDEQPQPRIGRHLARCPRRSDASCPVGFRRFEAQFSSGSDCGQEGGEGSAKGAASGRLGRLTLRQRPIKRGVNTEWLTRLVRDFLGLEEDVSAKAPQLHGRPQRPFQPFFKRSLKRLIAAREVDCSALVSAIRSHNTSLLCPRRRIKRDPSLCRLFSSDRSDWACHQRLALPMLHSPGCVIIEDIDGNNGGKPGSTAAVSAA